MRRTILLIGLVLLLMAVSLGCVGKEMPEGKEDVVVARGFSLTSTGFEDSPVLKEFINLVLPAGFMI